MGRKQTKLVKSQPLLVERHHKLWIPRAASGLSLLGLSPWTCRARATLLSWSLGCPPSPAFPWRPAGQPGLGPRGQRGAQPRGTHQLQRRRPPAGRAQARLCSRGLPRGHPELAWALRSQRGQAEWRTRGRPGRAGGRAGRVKAAQPWRPSWAAWRGPQGQRATSVRERERERVRGEGGRHTQDAHLARLCSGARSQEAEVKVKRCGGAAAPFARPDSLQEPRAGPAAPPCPLSLLEQMCGDPC